MDWFDSRFDPDEIAPLIFTTQSITTSCKSTLLDLWTCVKTRAEDPNLYEDVDIFVNMIKRTG